MSDLLQHWLKVLRQRHRTGMNNLHIQLWRDVHDESKAITINDERKKYGLNPIPGGDVALISICEQRRYTWQQIYLKRHMKKEKMER